MKDDLFKIPEEVSNGLDLAGKFKHGWVENSLDIENEDAPRLSISHTRSYLGTSIRPRGLLKFAILVAIGLFILVGRIFYLQILRGGYYRALAEDNRIRLKPIIAERGIIYDRFGNELVENVPSFSLGIVPQSLPRDAAARADVLAKVSLLSGLKTEDIENLLEKYKLYDYGIVLLKDNLDYDVALKLYLESANLPGVSVESGMRRNYLHESGSTATLSLSHILGYTGRIGDDEFAALKNSNYLSSDEIGKMGLEKNYENDLRGKYGRKKIEVNALGREQNILAVDPPVPGKNIYLSLDAEAQSQLEKITKNVLARSGKTKAAAIAMNPQNGEILALVSLPSFNNNDFVRGISSTIYNAYLNNPDHPLFNRAIAGTYPPGSTVKLVVSAAALAEKIVTPVTAFNSVGGLQVGKWFFKDWKAGGHGLTNITKALAWSVNTFFYYVGGGYNNFVGLGVDRLFKYFSSFGLAKKTGIDLPGESAGFLPSKEWKQRAKGETWFVGDTYNISIGQGDMLVTPLQDAVWTAAVANGGKIVQPHLATQIEDPASDKKSAIIFEPAPNPLVTDKDLQIVRQGMRECVTSGSCKLLQTLPFFAAAKTGTAQWSKSEPTHAWFTSFAPYDKPQIVVTVLVESGGEGATVAMPIARDFLAWWGKKYLTTRQSML